MKIKIYLPNGKGLWHEGASRVHGDEIEVAEEFGAKLIKRGLAKTPEDFDASPIAEALAAAGESKSDDEEDPKPQPKAEPKKAEKPKTAPAKGKAPVKDNPKPQPKADTKKAEKPKAANADVDLDSMTYDEQVALAKSLGINPVPTVAGDLVKAIEEKRGA